MAQRDLTVAISLQPKDQLASRLLQQFTRQQVAARNDNGHNHAHGDGQSHGHSHDHGTSARHGHEPDQQHTHGHADQAQIRKALAQLSPGDRALAEKQKICPVTDELLGSMGKPIKLAVNAQSIFVCCAGCADAVRGDPDKFLAKLKKP